MKCLILLISFAYLLHAGQTWPSYSGGDYSGGHGGYGNAELAPVGYHGPLAIPHVLPNGHIADTTEVAAAKHLHYSAVQKAQADAAGHGYSDDDGSYGSGRRYASSYSSGAGYGSSFGLESGYSSYSGGDYSGGHGGYVNAKHAPVGYHGPLAIPHVLPDGHIADTPEVAAAKHLHYSAVQKAQTDDAGHGYSEDDGSYGSKGRYASSYSSGAGYGSSFGLESGYSSYFGGDYSGGHGAYGNAKHAPVGYHGPLAIPHVLPDGHIADTPEVAAAKHLHYSAVQKAKAEAAGHGFSENDGSYGSGGRYASSYGSGAQYSSSYGSGAGYGSFYGSGAGHGSSYGSGEVYGLSAQSGAGYGSSYGSGSGYSGGYSYSGPLAYPKVQPSGLLADTHEVAAAKHAHLNAVAITANEHAQKWANNYYH